MNWADWTKRWLLPFVLLPVLALVLIDYLVLMAAFLKVAIIAYLLAQLLALGAGLVIGVLIKTNTTTPWKDLDKYNVVRLIPSLGWGLAAAEWALKEEPK